MLQPFKHVLPVIVTLENVRVMDANQLLLGLHRIGKGIPETILVAKSFIRCDAFVAA
jgi:hypothetical protein